MGSNTGTMLLRAGAALQRAGTAALQRAGAALQRKGPEIATAVVAMVVFAVLVAVVSDQWQAGRLQSDVETELAENLEEFKRTKTGLTELRAQVGAHLEWLQQGDSTEPYRELNIDLELPEWSDATWSIALASPEARHFDRDWVSRVSRIYELHDDYANLVRQIQNDIGGILRMHMTTQEFIDVLEPLNASLSRLMVLHEDVQSRLENALE